MQQVTSPEMHLQICVAWATLEESSDKLIDVLAYDSKDTAVKKYKGA